MSTEKLIIELDAKTGKLDATLKATDKNLDNLDKSTQKADKSFDDFGGTATKVGGLVMGVATAALAVKAAVDAMVLSSAQAVRENEVLARTAKTSTSNFMALSFALKQYNIDAKGAADAMNDVSERIGEFSAAASGPFQDFADVMGLNKTEAIAYAKALEKISAEDAIKKMVSDMQKANVEGPRMSFVLKSMSNDLEYASGAFADNSKELERLKGLYKDTAGQISITNEQASELKKAAESFDLMTGSIGAATNAISATLAPSLNEFFNSVISVVPSATQKIIDFINTFQDAENIKSMEDMDTQIQNLQDRASELDRYRGTSDLFGSVSDIAKRQELESVENRLNELYYARIELQKKINENSLSDADTSGGGQISGVGSGILTGNGALEDKELSAIADRFKSEEELLAQKFAKEYALAAGNEELRANLVREFDESVAAAKLEAEEAYMQASSDLYWTKIEEQNQERFDAEIEEQQRLLSEKLINEESYLKSVNDLAIKYGKVGVKDKKKENKDKEKSDLNYTETAMGAATALFGNNQDVKSANVIVDSAAGIQKAFADLPYPAAIGASLQIAASGVAQLAAINSASPSGGGRSPTSTASSSPASSGGGFSSSVEVNETVGSGSSTSTTSNVITFSGSSSDTVGMAMAEWFNNALASGEIKLGR